MVSHAHAVDVIQVGLTLQATPWSWSIRLTTRVMPTSYGGARCKVLMEESDDARPEIG